MSAVAASLRSSNRETLWRTLQTFNVTRIAIAVVLLAYLSINARQGFWMVEGFLYRQICGVYLVLADIVFISTLYVAAGGARSGLAILYLFPLAGSAVLAPMVLALFFTALA